MKNKIIVYPVSFRLDRQTLTELDRITQWSGRGRAQVLRRLILAAAHDERLIRALGSLESKPAEVHT